MRGFAFIGIVLLVMTALAGCLDDGAETGPIGPGSDDGSEGGNETAMLAPNATVVDGGASFDDALELEPVGLYTSNLSGGEHYYRFPVAMGDPINIELRDTLRGGTIPAPDNDVRGSFQILSPQGLPLETAHTNQGDTRLLVEAAPVDGEYRFLVSEDQGGFTGEYTFCFLLAPPAEHPCPDIGYRAQEIIYGGSLGKAHTDVLLIPPTHGDLGNPVDGATVLDYIDAAVSGIHEWVDVLHQFGDDYPEYAYLKDITVSIQIFDGAQDTADYDILIAYIETGGPQFRGVATQCADPPRCVLLSLFSNSPRAGQVLPDYPTYNDMEAVTKHEFAHVWGLGHTLTWTEEHGPDLMNSPATFVYGDGDPVGDGGVRTPKQCISTLNLYGMAHIFDFLAEESELPDQMPDTYELPEHIPYEWYCGSQDVEEGIMDLGVVVHDPQGLLAQ